MVKIEADGPEKRNCVKCRHRTNHYVEYGYKGGIAVRIPICPECKDIVGRGYIGIQIAGILKTVSGAIWASEVIEYDEKALRKERMGS